MKRIHWLCFALLLVSGVALATNYGYLSGWSALNNFCLIDNPTTSSTTEGNLAVLGSSTSATPTYVTYAGGDAYVDGNLEVHGTLYPPTRTIFPSQTDVSLTSPTVTFAAANKNIITLTSDANQTGIHPTGGTTGQIIYIVSGTGSNTMRFDDDATSMCIGGNITLTEAQNDVLALRCVTAPASTTGYGIWQRWFSSDN